MASLATNDSDMKHDGLMGPASRADLAIGLQMLRVSNINNARLQLAMLRRDRKQVVEAIEGLVHLDGEIRILVDDMPPSESSVQDLGALSRWIDDQKRAIASEKLALASGVDGRAMNSPRAPLEDEFAPEPESPAASLPDDAVVDTPAASAAPAAPRVKQAVPEPADDAAALALYEELTALDANVRRLPGRVFFMIVAAMTLLVLGAAILFAEQIQPLLPHLAL